MQQEQDRIRVIDENDQVKSEVDIPTEWQNGGPWEGEDWTDFFRETRMGDLRSIYRELEGSITNKQITTADYSFVEGILRRDNLPVDEQSVVWHTMMLKASHHSWIRVNVVGTYAQIHRKLTDLS